MRFDWIVIALPLLASAWFYSWSPAAFPTHWTSKTPSGLYAELADAYLAGQLHLIQEPDPALGKLADPYDPAQNKPYRRNDASYYAGHYYLYHGVAPVITLLLPFKFLTGFYLTEPAAIFLFCFGGAALSLLILRGLWRKTAPRASLVVLACCAIAMVFCQGYYSVLHGLGASFVAIAAAYFFLMLALWAIYRSLAATLRAWPWLGLAALAYGLAVGSRPNYIFGALIFLIPLLALWHRDGWRWSRSMAANLTAIFLPLALCVAGMLIHNYLRFGHLLEFGQRYQLGAWDQRALGVFNWKNLSVNAWHYLIAPGNFSTEFPFLTAPDWQAIGLLWQSPFVWLCVTVVSVLFFRRDRDASSALRPVAGVLALLFSLNLGTLLFLPSGNDQAVHSSANARYVFDFLPSLVLLGCLGVISLAHRLADKIRSRRLFLGGVVLLTMLSLLSSLSLDFQRLPLEAYRPLAQTLNWPTHVFKRWLGATYGPISMEVVFPAGKLHNYVPLVATGTGTGGNLLYVFYDSPETVRFGLVGTDIKGPLSAPIPVSYGQPHQLAVYMGSLYPPSDHPAMAAFDEATIARLKHTLRIDLDGKKIFEIPAHFYPAKSRQIYIGETHILRDYSAENFNGSITKVSRLPVAPAELTIPVPTEYGAVRLSVRFQRHILGAREPIIVTGVPQAGDFIYAAYAGTRSMVIGYDHWGVTGKMSKTLSVDFSVDHELEITLGSLYPPRNHVFWNSFSVAEVERLKRLVQVKLDGTVVLDMEQEAYESTPHQVFVGRNIIGGSTCQYEFTGRINSQMRLPPVVVKTTP